MSNPLREAVKREFQTAGKSHAGETEIMGWRISAMITEIMQLRGELEYARNERDAAQAQAAAAIRVTLQDVMAVVEAARKWGRIYGRNYKQDHLETVNEWRAKQALIVALDKMDGKP